MKKFIILKKLTLVLVLGLVSSCSSIYMPNVPATPMFRNKGEGYVGGHVGLKGNISGNLGVAVSDKIAVIANASTVDRGKISNHSFNQWLAEGALGYYTTLGKYKLQVLEVYAGYGVGNTKENQQRATVIGFEPVESRVMDFNKIFAQVNYSSTRRNKINLFGEKRELNYGTAIRLSRIAMQDFHINNIKQNKEQNLFLEPLFFTRMEIVKGLELQYTTGFNFSLLKNDYLKAGNSVFTLGITYNFGKK